MRSISTKILVLMFAAVAVLMTAFGFIEYTRENNEQMTNLEKQSRQVADRLMASLADPLWNFDMPGVEAAVQLEMEARDVVAVTVVDDQGKWVNEGTLYKEKKQGWAVARLVEGGEEKGLPAFVYSQEREIVQDDMTLATLTVYITEHFVRREMQMFVGFKVVQMLILSLLLISMTFLAMRTQVMQPVNHISELLKNLSEGEGDLTKRIHHKSRDELGLLTGYVNIFLDKMHAIAVGIKGESRQTVSIKERLGVSSEENIASITEITANIKSIEEQINSLDGSISESTTVMEEIDKSIDSLNEMVHEQSSAVSESTASVEEMIASLNNVASIVRGKKESTDQLVGTARESNASLEETNKVIQDVNGNIDAIMEMVSIINGIASQTNLLSMNAAIEAAHAGESGRGFAVVAEEIRKLAENSGANSKRIADTLKQIVEKIGTTSKKSEQTREANERVFKEIQGVANALDEIATSTQELSAGGDQILKAMTVLNEISTKVQEGSQEMKTGIHDAEQSVEKIRDVSGNVRNGMSEISAGTDEVMTTVKVVSDLATELGDSAERLDDQINKFKTQEEGDLNYGAGEGEEGSTETTETAEAETERVEEISEVESPEED